MKERVVKIHLLETYDIQRYLDFETHLVMLTGMRSRATAGAPGIKNALNVELDLTSWRWHHVVDTLLSINRISDIPTGYIVNANTWCLRHQRTNNQE